MLRNKLTTYVGLTLLIAAAASADPKATLVLPKIDLATQGTASGSVVLKKAGDSLSGFQFDFQYDAILTNVEWFESLY